jgi:hypothetical protein
MSGLSEVFYTFAITSGVGLILAIAKLCFKSKCSDIEICCLKIKRDTEAEEKEFEIESKQKTNSNSSSEKLSDDKI